MYIQTINQIAVSLNCFNKFFHFVWVKLVLALIIHYQYMKTFIILVALITAISHSKMHNRLERGMKLQKGDELISTLGYYKVVLNEIDCSLALFKFQETLMSFSNKNQKFTMKSQSPCSFIQIIDNKVITNSSNVLMQLNTSNLSYAYLSIDDSAALRLIGLKNPSGNPSPNDFEQIIDSTYVQSSKFIFLLDSYTQLKDKIASVDNNKNWIFRIIQQSLIISHPFNQYLQTYVLPDAYYTLNGVWNKNNQTFPSAIFPGILYEAPCSKNKDTLLGPFILIIDPYLPIVTIYDQDQTKIFEYSLLSKGGAANPCPKFMLSFKDQCVVSCPSPYLSIVQGESGKCILNCEYGAQIKGQSCICPNKMKFNPPALKCINGSSSYEYGCYCNNGFFFNKQSHSCQNSCSNQMKPYLGVCIPCSKNCLQCSFGSNNLYFLSCTKCASGLTLQQGICIYDTSCTPYCSRCNGSICLACQPFYVLYANSCQTTCSQGSGITFANLTSICLLNTQSTCNANCLKCANDKSCIVCYKGFQLLVTSISINCRRQNMLRNCISNTYNIANGVCYSNTSSSLQLLSKCNTAIPNCVICHHTLINICLLCKTGLLLQQNKCVRKCQEGYVQVNQGCVQIIKYCNQIYINVKNEKQTLQQATISNSFYQEYIKNGFQSSNQPYGYSLTFNNLFLNDYSTIQVESLLQIRNPICIQCQKGYGLNSDNTLCEPCPQKCILCLYSTTCLAKTNEQATSLILTKTSDLCLGFFTQQLNCISSCPSGTIPQYNSTAQGLVCANKIVSEQEQLKVDGFTYQINSNLYVHRFIFNKKMILSTSRLLQQSKYTIDASGNSITISSSEPTEILNLQGMLPNLVSQNGQFLSSSIYGISYETSFRNYISKNLAAIGYILSIFIIVLHATYIVNGVTYKMDNILIFCQSIFYFLFVRTLIGNPIAQFYFGWSWSHAGFFPNYFEPDLNTFQPTIAPYALYNLDGNIIRNAGSSISFILTLIFIWAIVSSILYGLEKYFGRKQVWIFSMSKNIIIALIQFASYNVFYWCVAFMRYDTNYESSGSFIGMAVLLLILVIIYMIGRAYFNNLAGLYMAKRIIWATILGSSFEKPSYCFILITLQILFGVASSLIEKPRQKWMLIGLWIEQGFIIIFLITLYYTINVYVVTLLITIFIYGWMMSLIADLADLYYLSKNRYFDISFFKRFFEEKGQQTHGDDSIRKVVETERGLKKSDHDSKMTQN